MNNEKEQHPGIGGPGLEWAGHHGVCPPECSQQTEKLVLVWRRGEGCSMLAGTAGCQVLKQAGYQIFFLVNAGEDTHRLRRIPTGAQEGDA